MTSISSSVSSYLSPRQLLQNELLSEVKSGSISSSDQTSLSTALDDIDQSLQADATSNKNSGPPLPDDLQSKISDLITKAVGDGKLTSDQADELETVFANTFSGGDDTANATGGVEGAGGDLKAVAGHTARAAMADHHPVHRRATTVLRRTSRRVPTAPRRCCRIS